MTDDQHLTAVRAVKARHEAALLRLPNVCGVGVGLRQRSGQVTDEICIVVMVERKVPAGELAPINTVPVELEGIPVDVQEVGRITA